MPNLKSNNRDQMVLIPRTIEDLLPQDHIVRFILDSATKQPVSDFEVRTDSSGKAQHDPRHVMALICYCLSIGINTSRRMEWLAKGHDEGKFIMGGEGIDHSTICRFIGKNSKPIAKFFIDVLKGAIGEGFASTKHLIVDGSKYDASADTAKCLKYKDVLEELEELDKNRDELIEQAEAMFDNLKSSSEESLAWDDFETSERFKEIYQALLKADRKLGKLQAAKKNLEDEAKAKVLAEIRRESEKIVLDKWGPRIAVLHESARQLKQDEDAYKAKEAELERESEFTRFCKSGGMQKERSELNRRGKRLMKTKKKLVKDLRAELKELPNKKPTEAESERRMEKLLLASPGADKRLNPTDPDARLMRKADNSFNMCYNWQLVIDKESGLAMNVEVTRDVNDIHQLRPVIETVDEYLDRVEKVDADGGYHMQHELAYLEALGFDIICPPNRLNAVQLKGTPQAEIQRWKLESPENEQRRKTRGLIEGSFGHVKHNLNQDFIQYRGRKKVQSVAHLFFTSKNLVKLHKLQKIRDELSKTEESRKSPESGSTGQNYRYWANRLHGLLTSIHPPQLKLRYT